MVAIIFVSSLTYTLLQSSAFAFKRSYDQISQKGNLHDSVVKQLFKNEGDFSLRVEDSQLAGQKKIVVDQASGDYQSYFAAHPFEYPVQTGGLDAEQEKILLDRKISEAKEWIQEVVNNQKPQRFQRAINQIYEGKLEMRHTASIAIFAEDRAFKLVHVPEQDVNVNKLIIYDGTKNFTKMLTDEQFQNEIDFRAQNKFGSKTPYSVNSLKGYRWVAQSSIGSTVTLTDPSAYQAIVSPSYANLNGKYSLHPSEVLNLYSEYDLEQLHENDYLKNRYRNNIVWVDQMPYFITGIGVTPDFAFPIIDHSRPIPTPEREAIVYTNLRGYQRAVDSFRSNPEENYFSIKYADQTLPEERSKIDDQVDLIARWGSAILPSLGISYSGDIPTMGWPKNVAIVTKYNQSNDPIVLTQERVIFLEQLKKTISTLTIVTTTFLVIFVATLFLLVFKSLLTLQRKKYATLLALGYRKGKIAFALSCVTFLLVTLPSILGYVVGYILQFPFINIFANYWTIPTYGTMFNLVSLIVTVIVPVVTIFLMVWILCYVDLHGNMVDMIAQRDKHKFSIARVFLKPFRWVNVKVKYIMSLTLSNFGRLMLSTLAGIISVATIIIGLSSLGKAQYAYDQTVSTNNYSFQVNFYSPTIEGGNYRAIPYSDAILAKYEPAQSTARLYPSDPNSPEWHIPSVRDVDNGANVDLINLDDVEQMRRVRRFLENKLQFKPLLDVTISSVNSWDIARKLMPDNQRNRAEANESDFYQRATQVGINQRYRSKPWWPTAANDWKVLSENKMIDQENIDPDFVDFVFNALRRMFDTSSSFRPYVITYNNLLVESWDEPYTYVSFNYESRGQEIPYTMIGLERESHFFKLSPSNWQKLTNYPKNDASPVIINRFISEKLGLGPGSRFNAPISNHVNRNSENFATPSTTFEVVDVIETYDDNRFLTLKSFANKLIGWDEQSKNFNGVLTNESDPIVLSTLSLYSPSYFYLATDTIHGQWANVVERMLTNSDLRYPTDLAKTLSDFYTLYSRTPYVAINKDVVWQDISNTSFRNISRLSSDIIWIIQMISVTLSILFAAIVSGLLISANRQRIAALWTLGYKRGEIMRMFALIYALPVFASIVVGVPVAFGILTSLKIFVINFGSILIPFSISWWAVLIAFAAIGVIFVFSTVVSIMTMKQQQAREAIGV